MKLSSKFFFILVAFLIGTLIFILNDDQEVFLESRESKTLEGNSIFNKIKMFSLADKDVWMMNQSHHGSATIDKQSWDRLAIVVDKSKKPIQAKFYQFESGPLEWNDNLKQKPFRVSCFLCHNNGPRNIRPNYDSPFNPTTIKDRIKISYWNIRMKAYGRVIPDPSHEKMDSFQEVPFRFYGTYENEILRTKTCMKCHQESGIFARGFLRRQQFPTIKFMLESGQMPPLGFSLPDEERSQIKKFIEGY